MIIRLRSFLALAGGAGGAFVIDAPFRLVKFFCDTFSPAFLSFFLSFLSCLSISKSTVLAKFRSKTLSQGTCRVRGAVLAECMAECLQCRSISYLGGAGKPLL